MTPIADMIRSMAAKGVSIEAIADAVGAVEAIAEKKEATRREAERIRQRNHRARTRESRDRQIAQQNQQARTRDSTRDKKEGFPDLPKKETHSEEHKNVPLRVPAHRLDPTWTPSKDGTDFAIFELGGQGPAFREFERFRDYWTAKSGAAATKTNWEATWRNWVRNTHDRGGSSGNGRNRKQSLSELANDMAEELREREREEDSRGTHSDQRSRSNR